MTKHCFEDKDAYCVVDWAIQTYNKWLDGRPKGVDIENLNVYIKWASIFIGTYII